MRGNAVAVGRDGRGFTGRCSRGPLLRRPNGVGPQLSGARPLSARSSQPRARDILAVYYSVTGPRTATSHNTDGGLPSAAGPSWAMRLQSLRYLATTNSSTILRAAPSPNVRAPQRPTPTRSSGTTFRGTGGGAPSSEVTESDSGRAPRSCDALPGASALGRKHHVMSLTRDRFGRCESSTTPPASPPQRSRRINSPQTEPEFTPTPTPPGSLCTAQRPHRNLAGSRLLRHKFFPASRPCPSALRNAINASRNASQSPNGPGGQMQGRAPPQRSLRAPAPAGVPAPMVALSSPKGKTWSART